MNTSMFLLYPLLLFTNSAFSMTLSDFIKGIKKDTEQKDTWATRVNAVLISENTSIIVKLDNGFNWYYYYRTQDTQFPLITIEKKELMALDFEKVNLLNNVQKRYPFSKKELLLFDEFPENLSNNLKNYFYSSSDGGYHFDSDYRLKFCYKKNITIRHLTKTIFATYKQLLPVALTTLLYHHMYIEDMENLWIRRQDPSLLALNEKKELTNKLIDELQAQNVAGSEFLEKKIITDVPFESVFPAHLIDLYYGNIRFKFIISAIIINAQLFYSFYYPAEKYYETRFQRERRSSNNILSFIFCNIAPFLGQHIITSLTDKCITTLLTERIFSHSIGCGLVNILVLITLYGILRTIVTSCISQLKIIDFPKDKFKNMTTKQVISHYLNKSSITIL